MSSSELREFKVIYIGNFLDKTDLKGNPFCIFNGHNCITQLDDYVIIPHEDLKKEYLEQGLCFLVEDIRNNIQAYATIENYKEIKRQNYQNYVDNFKEQTTFSPIEEEYTISLILANLEKTKGEESYQYWYKMLMNNIPRKEPSKQKRRVKPKIEQS